jgi:hypothetical protein
MKQLLGFVIGLLGLVLAALLILRIWNIEVVSAATVLRSGATLAVVAAMLLALVLVRFAFFKNSAAGYNARVGNRAHPRR